MFAAASVRVSKSPARPPRHVYIASVALLGLIAGVAFSSDPEVGILEHCDPNSVGTCGPTSCQDRTQCRFIPGGTTCNAPLLNRDACQRGWGFCDRKSTCPGTCLDNVTVCACAVAGNSC